mmetsp:Transcript_93399/g.145765  ORF Transcript_93399/g.145765 Transcript_93399/m.145765 type:complete len:251 (-) Transcript_93399:102-854(-)
MVRARRWPHLLRMHRISRMCGVCRMMVHWGTWWWCTARNWSTAIRSLSGVYWCMWPRTVRARVCLRWCARSWSVRSIRVRHHRVRSITPRRHCWIRPARIVHRSAVHVQRWHARHGTYGWSARMRIAPWRRWPRIAVRRRRRSMWRSNSRWAWSIGRCWRVAYLLAGRLTICLFFCLFPCTSSARMPSISIGLLAIPSLFSAPTIIMVATTFSLADEILETQRQLPLHLTECRRAHRPLSGCLPHLPKRR